VGPSGHRDTVVEKTDFETPRWGRPDKLWSVNEIIVKMNQVEKGERGVQLGEKKHITPGIAREEINFSRRGF